MKNNERVIVKLVFGKMEIKAKEKVIEKIKNKQSKIVK